MGHIMKRKRLLACLILVLGAALLLNPLKARAAGGNQPTLGDTLCLPGVYFEDPGDCLPLGPSEYLTRMARVGMRFPVRPLAVQDLGSEWAASPYYYAKVTPENANQEKMRIFNSLESAVEGKEPVRSIYPGFNYVSYIDLEFVDGRKYYRISPGEWVRGGELSGNVVVTPFRGLELLGTPETRFGWVLFTVQAQRTPGYNPTDYAGESYTRYDVLRVYDSVEVNDLTWHMIAPNRWIEQRFLALVYPRAEPPNGVDNGRWIELNLFEQTLAVYDGNRMVFATLVSSGLPGYWTRPGLFQITEKMEVTPMSGYFMADRSDFYYLEDVPWTLYFDQRRAFHGTYWHNSFGYVTSHGCANLSFGDSHWLYDWAILGDWVYVWDPSGETPEDPSLYGEGGA
jgi:hypothetical protein